MGAEEAGELLVRAPHTMSGYFNNQAATSATLDSEGWLRTGDIVMHDQDGDFFIVDRIKGKFNSIDCSVSM